MLSFLFTSDGVDFLERCAGTLKGHKVTLTRS